MAKTTSIALSQHHTDFIAKMIASGRYGNASEVVREALRLLEKHELELETMRRQAESHRNMHASHTR